MCCTENTQANVEVLLEEAKADIKLMHEWGGQREREREREIEIEYLGMSI